MKKISNRNQWHSITIVSLLTAYLYIFMEWLFFTTMPSFMSSMGDLHRIEILLISGGILALLSLIPILACFVLDLLFSALRKKQTNLFLLIAAAVPSLLIAALALLLIDNFTYTLLNLGIVSSRGVFRALYLILFFALLFFAFRWVTRFTGISSPSKFPLKPLAITAAILLSLSAFAALLQSSLLTPDSQSTSAALSNRPNILILGSDGVNANNTSLYGYERDTTPFLSKLAASSLLAENAFPNAGNSAGSVTSILTGKLPTQTRVLYAPNVLTGVDAYQHLPGILRQQGYFTAEIGIPNYVDSYDLNFRDGFDLVNQRSVHEGFLYRLGRKLGFDNTIYFLSRSSERIADRLLHIAFVRTMDNTFKIVTQPNQQLSESDRDRVDQIIDLFDKTDQPIFLHAHLMGSHGPQFFPTQQTFSKGEVQTDSFMTDFYDDSILDFDGYVKEIFDALQASGKLDNTIVVIYTDHNKIYRTTQRIPLMFYFPGGEHAGRIKNNVQNLDIAPTLIDYLGLPIPSWMSGLSLLKGEPPSDRLIFSTGASFLTQNENGKNVLDLAKIKPPFYQFGWMAVVNCQNWYRYDLVNFYFTSGKVFNHTANCPDNKLLSKEQIFSKLTEQLSKNNFDTSMFSASRFTMPTPTPSP